VVLLVLAEYKELALQDFLALQDLLGLQVHLVPLAHLALLDWLEQLELTAVMRRTQRLLEALEEKDGLVFKGFKVSQEHLARLEHLVPEVLVEHLVPAVLLVQMGLVVVEELAV
jgi:hypothetical protein